MTGRQRMEAAFSREGARDIPVVICYEGIMVRDHWAQLSSYPWWAMATPDVERQVEWRSEVARRIGQDWFDLPSCFTRDERAALSIEVRDDGVYRVDRRTGRETRLSEPRVGGSLIDIYADLGVATPDEIDAAVPPPRADGEDAGRGDLAAALLDALGGELFPICSTSAPLERCGLALWGFEGLMLRIATQPDLVEYACRRFLQHGLAEVRQAARRGAAGIFIEDIFTDIISRVAFARLNLPFVRALVDEARALGLWSVYYFCGSPAGKWDLLLAAGADALSLEESKKGFCIDIEAVVERVQGRCAVLGNLDAVGVLQDGDEAHLRAEVTRQIAAGRRNGSRFIMSIGSPVTPGTPVERVRLYCDLAHELGRA